MRRGKRFLGGLAVSVGLVFAAIGVAGAQIAPTIFGQAAQQSALSGREQLAQADRYLVKMESTAANIRRELESARAARDVVKSLCLNDKLSQMDIAMRSARDRRAALEQAISRQDTELAGHEMTVLDVLNKRVEQLTREASQCIGVDAYYIGESRVTVTIDPSIPQQDSSMLPDNQLVSAPPVCASCVR